MNILVVNFLITIMNLFNLITICNYTNSIRGESKEMSYYRHPKTLSEKKYAVTLSTEIRLDDLPVRYRAKRNNKNLPDSWWDICKRTERTWKNYRKQQYKNV